MTYHALLGQIEEIVGVEKNSFIFDINSIVKIAEDDESLRMNIRNDVDLNFVMDSFKIPRFYVMMSPIQSVPSQQAFHPHAMQQGFMNLLSAQNAAAYAQTGHIPSSLPNVVGCLDGANDDDTDKGMNQGSNEINHIIDDIEHDGSGDSSYEHDVCDDLDEEDDNGDHGSCSVQNENSRASQWVIPGALYQASIPFDDVVPIHQYGRDALSHGAFFKDKETLQSALGLYHLRNRVEYATKHSNARRLNVACKYDSECKFEMRATSRGTVWRVIRWVVPHTCQLDIRRHADRQLSSKVIAAYFAPTLINDGAVLKPKDMASQLLREYGFLVGYSTALRGRNRAINMVYGEAKKSFQLLPSYLHMIQQVNPGSIVNFQTNSSGCFQYAFMALHASIHGFLSSGRPVVVVDGTHLKGKYKGILFVAATKDGNEQIFPLAFGIGDKENDSGWVWFFKQLKKAIGCPNNLLFVSDQHRSIKNAVEEVYPSAHHGLCTYHLQKNLVKCGSDAVLMFNRAAYCYTSNDFDKHIECISSSSTAAFNRLMELGPEKWARSKCPVLRYEFLTSNCAESLNSRLRWARRLPMCTLLEAVRTVIGNCFAARRNKTMGRNDELTDYATKKLLGSIEEGRTMYVEPINAFKFKVQGNDRHYIVDLNARSCSCKEFDLDQIPCPHAAASILKAKYEPMAYVSRYYTMNTLRDMYSLDVNPTPNTEEWHVPYDVKSRVCTVPSNPRQAGRPRTQRIQSVGQSSICSKCHQPGHTHKKCIGGVPQSENEVTDVVGSSSKKRCRICHATGHNRRRCPSRVNAAN